MRASAAGHHLLHVLHYYQLYDRYQHVHCNYPGELQPGPSGGGSRHRRGRFGNVLHPLVEVRPARIAVHILLAADGVHGVAGSAVGHPEAEHRGARLVQPADIEGQQNSLLGHPACAREARAWPCRRKRHVQATPRPDGRKV